MELDEHGETELIIVREKSTWKAKVINRQLYIKYESQKVSVQIVSNLQLSYEEKAETLRIEFKSYFKLYCMPKQICCAKVSNLLGNNGTLIHGMAISRSMP